jgi:5-methylcytosine-specific restriction endonuclease McrA
VTNRCGSCGKTKPAEAFYKSKTTKSGLHGWCRDCSKKKAMIRYNSEQAARKREQRRLVRMKRRQLEREILRKSMTHKKCRVCHVEKMVDYFSKSTNARDGLQSTCKSCQSEYSKRMKAKRVRVDPDPRLTHKRCTRCGEKQPVSQFSLNRTAPDGYQYNCRACMRAYDQARYWKAAKESTAIPCSEGLVVVSMRRKLADLERRSILAALGTFDIAARDIRRLANSPCAHCGATTGLQIDHIIPVKRGGRHSIGNLQSLCKSCNASKNCLLEVEWRYGWSARPTKRAI